MCAIIAGQMALSTLPLFCHLPLLPSPFCCCTSIRLHVMYYADTPCCAHHSTHYIYPPSPPLPPPSPSSTPQVKPEDIPSRVTSLQDELRSARTELEKALADLAVAKAESLLSQAETVGSSETK